MSPRLITLSFLPLTLVLLTGGLGIRGLSGEDKPATTPSVTQEADKSVEMPQVPWVKFPSVNPLYLRIIPADWPIFDQYYSLNLGLFTSKDIFDQLSRKKPAQILEWRLESDESSGSPVGGGMVALLNGDFQLPKEFVSTLASDPYAEEKALIVGSLQVLGEQEDEFMGTFFTRFIRIDLDFPGGDFAQWLTALQESINVAYAQQMPEVLKPIMPAKITLDLRSDALAPRRVAEMKIKNMNLVSQPWWNEDIVAHFKATPTPPRWTCSTTGACSIRTLTEARMIIETDGITTTPSPIAYFNFRRHPEVSPQNVAALLDIRWKMNAPFVWGKTLYHPETEMMMVTGTEDEIDLANEVFSALTGKTESKSKKSEEKEP